MKPPEDSPGALPVKTVTAADLLIDLPAAPPPPANATPPPASGEVKRDSLGRAFDSAKFLPEPFDSKGRWRNARAGAKKRGAPTGPQMDIPEVGPEETPGDTQPGADEKTATPAPDAPPPRGDATLSPDAGGNLLARVLYGVTGWFTGDRKKATATGEEHKTIAGTFGAFLSFRGIALVGGLALVATVVVYLLEDSRGESVWEAAKRRFSKKPKPGEDAKRAEPTAEPATVAPASTPSASTTHVVFPE